MGVKGFIRDAETRTGISSALVQVEGILHPIRSVKHGAYWRLLLPGLHNICKIRTFLSKDKCCL